MIPVTNQLKEVDVITIPSRDFRMETGGEHVTGICEELEELRQTIFCILNTERDGTDIRSIRGITGLI